TRDLARRSCRSFETNQPRRVAGRRPHEALAARAVSRLNRESRVATYDQHPFDAGPNRIRSAAARNPSLVLDFPAPRFDWDRSVCARSDLSASIVLCPCHSPPVLSWFNAVESALVLFLIPFDLNRLVRIDAGNGCRHGIGIPLQGNLDLV